MTANIILTVVALVLAAALVGVGLLGAAAGNPRRAAIERQARKLLAMLVVLCPVIFGLILAMQAPAALGDRMDALLRQQHFGMTAFDMMIAALLAAATAGLAWETVRRWRHISKDIGRSLLLIGFVFCNLARGRLDNPLLLELEFAFLAALTIFAARFAWLAWLRPDGGASA